MTQSELAALDERPPALLELLPVVTDELLPPPGEMVVEPLTPPCPVVIVVEFEEPVFAPSFLFVTTRHGLPLTMTVPSDPEVTATLSARTGAAAARNPMVRRERVLLWMRIRK